MQVFRLGNFASDMETDSVIGAGKSTLIKILIERCSGGNKLNFQSPMTSGRNDRVPTTGDVHLYADPSTFESATPRLYADCEGFDGGETIPRGLRHRGNGREDHGFNYNQALGPKRSSLRSPLHVEGKKKFKRSRHSAHHNILWSGTENSKKREFSVLHLYPRLLYTFSDTVVFVLRNPRYALNCSARC